MTETVKQLLIINILFYIGANIVGDPAYQILSLYFPENPNFQFWQPLTHMFMHARFKFGGIMHILFNMLALVSFGSLLERMWGGKKFLFFYISAGLGAAALHIGINYISFYNGLEILEANGFARTEVLQILSEGKYLPPWKELMTPSQFDSFTQGFDIPAVGASGAIYGLLVAFAMIAPNAELMLMFIPIPIKAKYFVPGLLLVDLYLGLNGNSIFGSGGSGVAHFAHIGGALVGFIMMWYWKNNSFNNKRWN